MCKINPYCLCSIFATSVLLLGITFPSEIIKSFHHFIMFIFCDQFCIQREMFILLIPCLQSIIQHSPEPLEKVLLSAVPQLQARKPVCMFTHNLKLKNFYQCEVNESAGFLHNEEGDRELSKQGNVIHTSDLSVPMGVCYCTNCMELLSARIT